MKIYSDKVDPDVAAAANAMRESQLQSRRENLQKKADIRRARAAIRNRTSSILRRHKNEVEELLNRPKQKSRQNPDKRALVHINEKAVTGPGGRRRVTNRRSRRRGNSAGG